jgi:hypothetical protein
MISLREAVFTHPEYLAMCCFTWVAIAIWVVSLIGWMIQGDVDPLFGLAGITVGLMLGYFSIRPPIELVRPFTALAAVVTIVVFPMLRRALNERALLSIDIDAMENAYELLRMKPDNTMMRFKLGRLLYERGHVETGLAVVGEALKGMPERLFTEEYRMYGRWRRNNPHIRTDHRTPCIECGFANPPAAIFCERCNHAYLLDIVRGRWVGRQFAKKLIAGWVAAILALAGIPLASALPPVAAISIIVGIMIAAIALLWLAFREAPKPMPGVRR